VPIEPCPACATATPNRLDSSIDSAVVDFFRCTMCGHVWTVEKLNPSVVTHVTPFLRVKPDRRRAV
jgi:hypothetical protein